MKKISFEELCDLVAHVDYLWENTFPIYFKVDSTEYVAGIGYYDCGDDTGDPFGVFGITEELQYLARLEPKIDKEDNTITFLDVDDPDDMTMCVWIMVGRLLTVASFPIIMRQMSLISRSSN